MHYFVLAPLFFASMLLALTAALVRGARPALWRRHRQAFRATLAGWFGLYLVFIAFFTGPGDLTRYPPREASPWKLPWQGGISRFVAQGNRSFTSHRDNHEHAWDFVMPNGTPVLAARAGRVQEVKDQFGGIGFDSNVIVLEHDGGLRSLYAHIQRGGALVKVGELVKQGQPIALSGMVGQTIFPHVHFLVRNQSGASIPVSFSDVPAGVPLAGRFYTSGNQPR
jgi:murein DD-endopeptidase MepM/ murein hydrolase activator NlpD